VTCLPPFLQPGAGLFAQASFSTNLDDFTSIVQSAGRRTRMDYKGDLILLGSIILVAGLVFYLTAVFRKRRRRHRGHREWSIPETARPDGDSAPVNGKNRRRKRRRDHRPLNPTRAEAGGLPPKRDDELPPG
jgi:hypothetical protein